MRAGAAIVLDDTDEPVRNCTAVTEARSPGAPCVSGGPHPAAPRSAAALMAGGISSAIEHQRCEILSRLTCTCGGHARSPEISEMRGASLAANGEREAPAASRSSASPTQRPLSRSARAGRSPKSARQCDA